VRHENEGYFRCLHPDGQYTRAGPVQAGEDSPEKSLQGQLDYSESGRFCEILWKVACPTGLEPVLPAVKYPKVGNAMSRQTKIDMSHSSGYRQICSSVV
jgi:hypothetical protein